MARLVPKAARIQACIESSRKEGNTCVVSDSGGLNVWADPGGCVARVSCPRYNTWYIIFRVSPFKCSRLRFFSKDADPNLHLGHSFPVATFPSRNAGFGEGVILALYGITFSLTSDVARLVATGLRK